jgi:hypothetical protein
MSRIAHNLVGYDRVNERVAEELNVPDAVLPRAKELARVPGDDPDVTMCYALDVAAARELAQALKTPIDTERCDYFLEGYKLSYEFAEDAEFRPDQLAWSTWVHDDVQRARIKVSVARTTLDDFTAKWHPNHGAVIDLLNAKIKDKVQETINRAIDDGRATAERLELNEHDLAAMLDA